MRWAYQTRLFVCAVLLTGSVVGNVCSAQEGVPAVKYFLDEKPDNADVSKLPASARQPLIAKVRVVSITSSTSRDGGSPTNDQFLAELRLLELYSGDAPATQEIVPSHLTVTFVGSRGEANIFTSVARSCISLGTASPLSAEVEMFQ